MILSVVVPAHNEEKLITGFAKSAKAYFDERKVSAELVIVENGSRDRTYKLLEEEKKVNNYLVIKQLPSGNKGLALKEGFLSARGEYIVALDADLWDESFIDSCLEKLTSFDVVVGSKSIKGAKDERPLASRLFNKGYNFMFKLFFNFQGTETHAKLAFRREKIIPLVKKCQSGDLVFDTELIIRAERAGLSKIEIPTTIKEIRPRVWSFKNQLLKTVSNFILLLRVLGPSPSIPYLISLLALTILIIGGFKVLF